MKIGEALDLPERSGGGRHLAADLVSSPRTNRRRKACSRAARGRKKARYFDGALQKYLACLAKDPLHRRALARTAELYARRGEYAEGPRLRRESARGRACTTPKRTMFTASSPAGSGRSVDAKEALGWAARSMEFRSAAYQRLAEIALSEKKFDLAVEYAQRSIEVNTYNSGAYEILAAAHRKAGRPEAARTVLAPASRLRPARPSGPFRALSPRSESEDARRIQVDDPERASARELYRDGADLHAPGPRRRRPPASRERARPSDGLFHARVFQLEGRSGQKQGLSGKSVGPLAASRLPLPRRGDPAL